MMFTSIPFVVRTVQPVLETLKPEYEEAAETLGASRFQIFCRVIWPEIAPQHWREPFCPLPAALVSSVR